jgi:hypothetical protein
MCSRIDFAADAEVRTMSQSPKSTTRTPTDSGPASLVKTRIPALKLGVALALHFWFGAMGGGWWFTEWLITRADESLPSDNMLTILAVGALLWIAAAFAIVRLHRRSARLTWLPLLGWIVAFAALFLLR